MIANKSNFKKVKNNKIWAEFALGLVRFVYDLRTLELRMVIQPGTPDEFNRKLKPSILSKGPRAYVARVVEENSIVEKILAIQFNTEEDSRTFRRLVDKRHPERNQKNVSSANKQNRSNYSSFPKNQANYSNRFGMY